MTPTTENRRAVVLVVVVALVSLMAVLALPSNKPSPWKSPSSLLSAMVAATGHQSSSARSSARSERATVHYAPTKRRALTALALRPLPENATQASPGLSTDFVVLFNTTKGLMIMDVHRSWAPLGAERFHRLVTTKFFEHVAFFRVIKGFMAQFGISGDPATNARWGTFPDDPVVAANVRGMVTYGTELRPNTRATQIYINFGDNRRLDAMGFAPFAKLRDESLPVLDRIYSGYGEEMPRGKGPREERILAEGDKYLKEFPLLDYILEASVVA